MKTLAVLNHYAVSLYFYLPEEKLVHNTNFVSYLLRLSLLLTGSLKLFDYILQLFLNIFTFLL